MFRCSIIRKRTHLVPSGDAEGEDHVSAGAVASLVVVVIDEHHGVIPVQHAPAFVEVAQPPELIAAAEGLAQVLAVLELRHASVAGVFRPLDGLATCRRRMVLSISGDDNVDDDDDDDDANADVNAIYFRI